MTYYVQRASFSLKGITFASLKFVCLVVSVVFGVWWSDFSAGC